MARTRPSRDRPALDVETLERLALFYVGRYATTRAKLSAYLRRKLAERGWTGAEAPPIERIVGRCAELGYVDDRAFAASRAAALARRGYGARRVSQALRAAGIEEEDAAPVRRHADDSAWDAALVFARRRRIGPFGDGAIDPDRRRKMFAAMLRAGHAPETARRILAMPAGDPDAGTFCDEE